MTKPRVTVLLTCAASPMAVEAIQALQASRTLRVRVVGVDMDRRGPGARFASAFSQVPAGTDPGYADRLLTICRREGVRVVIPTSDEEALALARVQDRFRSAGITCTVPRAELIELFADKARMYQALAQCGVAVPRYERVTTIRHLREAASRLGYPARPFVIKPSAARGGRGVWLIREGGASLEELLRGMSLDAIRLETYVQAAERAATLPPLVAMECFSGDVFDVDLLGVGGRLKTMVARRRFHPRSTPFRGCVLERHPAVLALARSVHQALKLDYLHDVDIMLDAQGGAHLLEVNPRQSASVIATVSAGLNLLEHLVRRALDLDVPVAAVPYGVSIRPSVRTTCVSAKGRARA